MRTRVMRFNSLIHQSFFLMAAVLCLWSLQVRAEDAPPAQLELAGMAKPQADEGADPIRETIAQQLAAIEARNASLTWALATQDLHEKFETPDLLLSTMRIEYRPLYNHKNHKFLDCHDADGARVQAVEISDRYTDTPITVLYRMEQQADGQWLIDSFTILDTDAQPI